MVLTPGCESQLLYVRVPTILLGLECLPCLPAQAVVLIKERMLCELQRQHTYNVLWDPGWVVQLVGGRGWGLGAPIKVKSSSKEGVEKLELELDNIISNGSRTRTLTLFPLDVQLEKQGLWEDPVQFWKSGPLLC